MKLSPAAKALLRGFFPLLDRDPRPDFSAAKELLDAGYIIEEAAEDINPRYWCVTVKGLDAKRKL